MVLIVSLETDLTKMYDAVTALSVYSLAARRLILVNASSLR